MAVWRVKFCPYSSSGINASNPPSLFKTQEEWNARQSDSIGQYKKNEKRKGKSVHHPSSLLNRLLICLQLALSFTLEPTDREHLVSNYSITNPHRHGG